MAKKRKTRQQKIITQLKRQLAQERARQPLSGTKTKPRQEAISIQAQTKPPKLTKVKKAYESVFSYNPKLIRRDLLKTALLTLLILSLEFVLYLKLR